MPRYKPVHQGLKLLPVDFDKQVQPGSLEYALCYLVDRELNLINGVRVTIGSNRSPASSLPHRTQSQPRPCGFPSLQFLLQRTARQRVFLEPAGRQGQGAVEAVAGNGHDGLGRVAAAHVEQHGQAQA